MNDKTKGLVTLGLLLVTVLVTPTGASLGPANLNESNSAVERYWEAVGQPVRERLGPLVASVAPYAHDPSDLYALLDTLEESENELLSQLSAGEDGTNEWKLFAVAEACTGRGSCGGSAVGVNGDHIETQNYIAQGDISFVICSGNGVQTNTVIGDNNFVCTANMTQTPNVVEASQGDCTAPETAPTPFGAARDESSFVSECAESTGVGVYVRQNNNPWSIQVPSGLPGAGD